MNVRRVSLSMALMAAAFTAHAADGLAAPAAETLWPQWQARITVLTAPASPLAAWLHSGNTPRGLQGGALLGDYYFTSVSLGGFRASGGLLSGSVGGLPLASGYAGPRLGLSVVGSNGPTYQPGADGPATVPYLGLGFTGSPWRSGLSVTADVGMVAERAAAAAGLGRAVFGTQGFERSLQEMRLSPVLQLGMRYNF
jgi:hypothetical protein